jgi:hypothetical protein
MFRDTKGSAILPLGAISTIKDVRFQNACGAIIDMFQSCGETLAVHGEEDVKKSNEGFGA